MPTAPSRRRVLGSAAALAGAAAWPLPTAAADAPDTSPGGRIVEAGPADYLARLRGLQPGDTLVLAPGRYGVDARGRDTDRPPGLPVFDLQGRADAPIVITGQPGAPRPLLLGRATHNTIRFARASHVVVRGLEVFGRFAGTFGAATSGPTHHITLEDNVFHGLSSHQQVVGISTTGFPTWGWVIRRNLIVGCGTGIYLGNSNGDSPFVGGLIEHNVIRDVRGYCLQVKHQLPWGEVPAGMPTGAVTTIIRHNVFAKSANSSTGADARPNLLLGDQPPSGPGADNGFRVVGNFFHENPGEALFQAEGRVDFHHNLMFGSGHAIRLQRHNGVVRDVNLFHNTIVCGHDGITISGGAPGHRQRVVGNAVFAGVSPLVLSGEGATESNNATGTLAQAREQLMNPFAPPGRLDLRPRPGELLGSRIELAAHEAALGWDRDFDGRAHDPRLRGAYGRIFSAGWAPAIEFKP